MNAYIGPTGIGSDNHLPADASRAAHEGAGTYTLRRTGRKAVRFDGWQLVEAIGSEAGRHIWHDLNIYRTVKGCIIVELIVRGNQPDHQDVFHVKTFEDLTAAAAWLESYRCADDVPIPAGLGEAQVALPWAVLQAVQLRQSMDRLESDYQALLSEVFAALDLTDPAEAQPAPARRKQGSRTAA
jgi:hypothetical protein